MRRLTASWTEPLVGVEFRRVIWWFPSTEHPVCATARAGAFSPAQGASALNHPVLQVNTLAASGVTALEVESDMVGDRYDRLDLRSFR
jgi:hypothetical protein